MGVLCRGHDGRLRRGGLDGLDRLLGSGGLLRGDGRLRRVGLRDVWLLRSVGLGGERIVRVRVLAHDSFFPPVPVRAGVVVDGSSLEICPRSVHRSEPPNQEGDNPRSGSLTAGSCQRRGRIGAATRAQE